MDKLKELRESAQFTQIELAEKIGVRQSTIAMWETGQSFPRVQLLPKLAGILNCTVDELLGITKTPTHAVDKATTG